MDSTQNCDAARFIIIIVFNLFNKKILIKHHKEDFYLVVVSLILILLVFFNDANFIDLIISVLSSLANSGISSLESNNDLNLYFL